MKSLLLALLLIPSLALADTGDILGLEVRTATGVKPLTITAPTAGSVLKFSGTPATPLNIGTLATADITGLQTALDAKQTLDADLTTIAGLTATSDNILQSVSGAWASRTPAQLKATLSLAKGDVGLGDVDNTTDLNKPISTATQTALDLKANLASPTFSGTSTFSTGSVLALVDGSMSIDGDSTVACNGLLQIQNGGSIQISDTSYLTIGQGATVTYGVGAATAHRTALGLTSISTVTSGAGVETFLTTPSSSNLRSALTDESGTGEAIFSTTPTFKTSVKVNNPANTFAYTLTPAAIAADRILNLPLTTGTDTLAVLGGNNSQVFTGTQYFDLGIYVRQGYGLFSTQGTNYIGIRTSSTVAKIYSTGSGANADINMSPNDVVAATFKVSGKVLDTKGGRIKVVTVDTSTSLTLTDAHHVVTCSNAGAVTVNLPAGVTGTEYIIKNKGAGTVTITPNGSQKLFTTAQVATLALVTGKACIIIFDGTDWSVVSDY